jgi:hypothetical protein
MKQFCLALIWLVPASAYAADIPKLNIQVHGTLAQGAMLSSHNDYLTAPTSHGTVQWTEAVLNAGKDFTDRFRVGAQLHSYRLGELGKFKVEIDWAYGEYRFTEWAGIRAGKIKTRLGLFNDTQDIDALHLWSLLPQGVYPADNRSWTLAHTGGDFFGRLELPAQLGRVSYQGYLGRRTVDSDGGYFKLAADEGITLKNTPSGLLYGGDLRWHTPLRGLTAGASLSLAGISARAEARQAPFPFTIQSTSDTKTAFYGEFDRGKFYAAAEFRRSIWNMVLAELHAPMASIDARAWYVMGAFRVRPRLQVGAYYSGMEYASLGAPFFPYTFGRSGTDWVLASRFDPNPHVYLKVEGHYMDGTPLSQGFYPSFNDGRPDRLTRLLVARIGFTF